MPAATLWGMVTTRPAAALGVADRVGSLKVGAWADVVAFADVGEAPDPLDALLHADAVPARVWIAGNAV